MAINTNYNFKAIFKNIIELDSATVDCSICKWAIKLRNIVKQEKNKRLPDRELIGVLENAARLVYERII